MGRGSDRTAVGCDLFQLDRHDNGCEQTKSSTPVFSSHLYAGEVAFKLDYGSFSFMHLNV